MKERTDSTRVVDLFSEALQKPPSERDGFLTTAAAGDTHLKARVTRLLRGADFIQDPVAELQRALRGDEDSPGQRAGAYELVRPIASGGMGAVWLARRADQAFEAVVALKLIKRGMDTDDILARFRAERQVLANLRHSNIAALLDGGATDDGRPYLVMEYVDGAPIDRFCHDKKLPIEARIALFRKVCAAVEHAHRATVVHRDIKPANILVTEDGTPKLLDFGIAKVTTKDAEATATRHRILTPGYASPEQVRGEPITTSTDVYSLGVVLYELLCGRRPYKADQPSAELERAVCEIEPPRPSLAALQGPGGRAQQRRLAGDLDTIVMMALRKEPARRYGSVEQLSEDLRRHLDGLPVLARPDTVRYRAGKFVRRNKVLVVAATAVIASLITGLAMSTSMYLRARDASKAEAEQKVIAQNKTAESERLRSLAEWRAYSAQIGAALGALRAEDVAGARRSLEQTAPELRGWEYRYTLGQLDASTACIKAHDNFVYDLKLSPDGTTLASAGQDGLVKLWDRESLAPKETIEGFNGSVGHIAYSPDGAFLAIPHGGRQIIIWDLAAHRALQVLGTHISSVRAVSFLPDGRLLTGGMDRRALLWSRQPDGHWGKPLTLPGTPDQVRCAAVSPDGSLLVTGGRDEVAHFWDAATGNPAGQLTGHTGWLYSAAFSPDGSALVSASADRTLRVWDLKTRQPIHTLRGHTERVVNTVYSPDGRLIASASWDRSVRLWDAKTGDCIRTFLGHENNAFGVVFSPDSRTLYSCADDGTIRVWDVPHAWSPPSEHDDSRVMGLSLGPDASWLAAAIVPGTGDAKGGLFLWDRETNRRGAELATGNQAERMQSLCVAARADGSLLAAGFGDGIIGFWDSRSFAQMPRGTVPASLTARDVSSPVRAIAFVSDNTVASGSNSGVVRLWDTATGEELARWSCHKSAVRTILADAGRIVSGGDDGEVVVHRVADGAEVGRLSFGAEVVSTAISPDGALLAVGAGRDAAAIALYSWPDLQEKARLRGHTHQIYALAFSPDSARLASASFDHTVKIWDTRRAMEAATLYGHDYGVFSVAWGPDGAELLSGAADGGVRTWSGRPRPTLNEPRTK